MELPQDAHGVSTSASHRSASLRIPSKTPLLQRSANTIIDAIPSRGSMFSNRQPQEQGKLMLPKSKEKDKGGTKHRLLKVYDQIPYSSFRVEELACKNRLAMVTVITVLEFGLYFSTYRKFEVCDILKNTFKREEKKEKEATLEMPTLVPFGDVVGCLAIHIKNCRHFTPKIILTPRCTNLFIRITINNVVKCTKICTLLFKSTEKSIAKFDEVKYFSVQIPRRQDDDRNNIYVELMKHEDSENYPILLGSVQVHLYEVIQKGCFTEEFRILNKNIFICRLEIEFMFSYGNFGFGFSHQLKPLQKIIEPSMFMNVAPPPERADPVSNVILPQPLEYPAFLSPDLNVTVGKSSKYTQPSVIRLEKLQQPPRERLEKMKKEYRNLNTWIEKSSYLENILSPVLEYSTPTLFYFVYVCFHGIFVGGSFHVIPGIPLGLSFEAQHLRPFCVYVAHGCLFIVAVDEQQPIISWYGLEVPNLFDSFVKLSLRHSGRVARIPESPRSEKRRGSSKFQSRDWQLVYQCNPALSNSAWRNNISEVFGNLSNDHLEEKSDIQSLDRYTSLTSNKVDSIPNKLLDDKSLPTFNLSEDHSDAMPPKSDESEKQTSHPLSTIPTIQENKIPPSDDYQFSPSQETLNYRYPSPIKIESPPAEVLFLPEESPSPLPSHKPKHTEKNEPYPFKTLNIQDNFDAFLQNINHKMSIRKKKDEDMSKCRNISNAEVIEHEDQDPPYPAHSKAAGPSNKIWAHDPDVVTIKPLHTKLKERLPNVSLPSSEEESSTSVNVTTSHLSKPLTSHTENQKQPMVLKSILNKNLKDLLEQLFSNLEVPLDIQSSKKSYRSPFLSVHNKLLSSLEDEIFENFQDLESWLLEKDVLNSKSSLCQITKVMSLDSLSEGGSGKSIAVETEHSSVKDLVAANVDTTVQDCVIKQLFTAKILPELEKEVKEHSGKKLNNQDQLPTTLERILSSNSGDHCEKKDDEKELSQSKSAINQIMQAFPEDTLLEYGLNKVIDKEHQVSSSVGSEKGTPEEKSNYSTEEYSKIKRKTKPLSDHTPKHTTCVLNTVRFLEEDQNLPPKDSKYHSIPDIETELPLNGQGFYKEENDLKTTLENLSNSLMDKLNESGTIILKSFFKHILDVFFKYNQSKGKGQPERDLQRLMQYSFTNDTEDLEEIRENFDQADKLDRKPILNPKLCVFLEELSDSEIKDFKSELSKHIQHYLVERLSELGHITKKDLPKIYQNLYLMNENSEPGRQNMFPGKYSEAVNEIMSFLNNFHHHFIDKHLEIKLKSFLSEILKNYFRENLSGHKLFKDTESRSMHLNTSNLSTESASISVHDSGQDISGDGFGRRFKVNTIYPLNKSLQNYLRASSENELLNIKLGLRKHLQSLFLEKLSKSGLITKRQLEDISQQINLINSSSRPLKCIQTDLCFRDENNFMEEHLEKQNKYLKIAQKTTLHKRPEDRLVETELIRKEEKEYFPLHNTKENVSKIMEQKRYCCKEGATRASFIKVQPCSNKNTQIVPLNKSSEKLTDTMFKHQRKEHEFIQLPGAENSVFKIESQDPYSWDNKIIQSNTFFERTLKMNSIEKKDHMNIYKLTVQGKPEAGMSRYPRIPRYNTLAEDEEPLNRVTFPSWQSHPLSHFTTEVGGTSKLEDQYCQRWKGSNNNNKKQHSVTFAEYKREMPIHFKTPTGKYVTGPESQSFKYKVLEVEKSSKPSLFPEVLKRESAKPMVRKERNNADQQKKSLNKIVKMLPTTLPPTRIHLKKSIPRTLLHWTARTTIHDCSDKFEDLPVTSYKHFEKIKPRARLLGKNPDDSQNQSRYSARPYTAPDTNKRRRKGHSGRCRSPRLVSAGLVHINDTISNYEMHKIQQKKQLKENLEECSLICDTIQMLDTSE
ncbi:PREDICTED: uncharacterized protein LOC102835311 [Chrysochloris asiatica]|uniref:Uncharacterized protein LOC102835311 n=1 Tax=Chrysochloris asiatica TaxID=185453 RepID=A0A9B0WLK0_CHRAS|nr:PREDICTED: uncharacterized protein LOC102835311 [Chrysochloris asiatica]